MTPSSPGRRPARKRGRSAGLNERQQIYLDVLYTIDQDNEEAQKRRWHAARERQPAEQWRWITYGIDHPAADTTPVQQQLAQQHVLDAGAGATLSALHRRGLIELRHTVQDSAAGPVWHTQVRLTRTGRATARARRPPPPEDPAKGGQLPPWLHAALQTVADAPSHTLAKVAIGRVAARRLGPHGHGYIEDASAWQYRLTPAGQNYLDRASRDIAARARSSRNTSPGED